MAIQSQEIAAYRSDRLGEGFLYYFAPHGS